MSDRYQDSSNQIEANRQYIVQGGLTAARSVNPMSEALSVAMRNQKMLAAAMSSIIDANSCFLGAIPDSAVKEQASPQRHGGKIGALIAELQSQARLIDALTQEIARYRGAVGTEADEPKANLRTRPEIISN